MNQSIKDLAVFFYSKLSSLTRYFDRYFISNDVGPSKFVSHQKWQKFLHEYAKFPGCRVLEIGSREVTGVSKARENFSGAEYVGFDYYKGNNVDMVGDAHMLSAFFPDYKFDIVYSSATFEHFAMPWVVAGEIAKVLKVGGIVFIETHFSFSSHERPWHFFQFSDLGLKALFSGALGFECLDSGMDNPIVGRFSSYSDKYLRFRPVGGLYCHSQYLGKKVRDVPGFNWNMVKINHVVGKTRYPEKCEDR